MTFAASCSLTSTLPAKWRTHPAWRHARLIPSALASTSWTCSINTYSQILLLVVTVIHHDRQIVHGTVTCSACDLCNVCVSSKVCDVRPAWYLCLRIPHIVCMCECMHTGARRYMRIWHLWDGRPGMLQRLAGSWYEHLQIFSHSEQSASTCHHLFNCIVFSRYHLMGHHRDGPEDSNLCLAVGTDMYAAPEVHALWSHRRVRNGPARSVCAPGFRHGVLY